jgi:hypothetical protein
MIEDLFQATSSDEEEEIALDTIKYVIENIASGKILWSIQSEGDESAPLVGVIIEQLIHSVDYSLIDDFFISHRLFTNTIDLLDKLVISLAHALDSGHDSDDGEETSSFRKVRVFALLQRWVVSPYVQTDLDTHKEYLRIRLRAIKDTCITDADSKLIDSLLGKLDKTRHNVCEEKMPDESDRVSIKSSSSSMTFWKNLFPRSRTGTGDSMMNPVSSLSADSMTSLDTILTTTSGTNFIMSNTTESICEALFVIERRVFMGIEWRELIEFPLVSSTPKASVQAAIDHFNTVNNFG